MAVENRRRWGVTLLIVGVVVIVFLIAASAGAARFTETPWV